RHDGLAIFVPYAAPGERLRVRITERKKNFARGVIDRILEPSPSRRDPPCQYFGDCGGCQLQHISYEAQLESKIGFVRDALERIGRIDWPHEIRIRHAAEFGYRSRAQVKIDRRAGRVGFNRAASNAVCDVTSCPILVPELDEALRSLWSALGRATDNNRGLPNRLQVEMAAGESGVSFEPALDGLPGGALQRTVKDAIYSFSASTFFQGNPSLLDELVNEAVGETSGDLAIDLYAGVGLFTIQLARRFSRVIGVEADTAAAEFARENINANQNANVEFHNSPAALWLKSFVEAKSPRPDLVILDPPRNGAAEAITHIVGLNPARITYVSCDPTTLARDLRTLLDSGHELTRITAIDLFPQTYHVETVAALERR
ncbi:MAG TPA: class I SAM-dependent RNA methyltransferase, partial [Blastocatellia bacterium]|nr:class I SAM-dependent RNA methyltransferase [Blastocatellia bacterium]